MSMHCTYSHYWGTTIMNHSISSYSPTSEVVNAAGSENSISNDRHSAEIRRAKPEYFPYMKTLQAQLWLSYFLNKSESIVAN